MSSSISPPSHNHVDKKQTITVKLNTNFQNAQRFPVWLALFVISIICIVALQTRPDRNDTVDKDGTVRWVLSVYILSMIISLVAIVMYLISREIYMGKIFEMIKTLFLVALWAGGLPCVMNPANSIAVTKPSIVIDANLYYFSWLAFCLTIYLSGTAVQEYIGFDSAVKSVVVSNKKTALWFGLSLSSLIVMIVAIRVFINNDCDSTFIESTKYCKRTKLGISLGVLSLVMAVSMTILTHHRIQNKIKFQSIIELVVSIIQVLIWTFGIGYITFGDGPGSLIGNFYFSTWVSFLLAVFVLGMSVVEMTSPQKSSQEEPNVINAKNTYTSNTICSTNKTNPNENNPNKTLSSTDNDGGGVNLDNDDHFVFQQEPPKPEFYDEEDV